MFVQSRRTRTWRHDPTWRMCRLRFTRAFTWELLRFTTGTGIGIVTMGAATTTGIGTATMGAVGTVTGAGIVTGGNRAE